MSRKLTNIKSDVVNVEFGEQSYRTKKDYMTQRRLITEKSRDYKSPVKQSEFVRPYASDENSYQSMEYFTPPPPGFDLPGDYEWPEWAADLDAGIDPYDPWHIICWCKQPSLGNCICPGVETTITLDCTWPIVDVEYAHPQASIFDAEDWDFSFTKNTVTVTAPEDAWSWVDVDITMEAKVPYTSDPRSLWKRRYKTVICKREGIHIFVCKPYRCCDTSTAIAWDYGNSTQTIGQSDSISIAITGSGTPYTWAVTGGTGYTLGSASTEGLTNTLTSAADASCGVCEITVTDCNGDTAIGEVRQAVGGDWNYWPSLDHTCPVSGRVQGLILEGTTPRPNYFDQGKTRVVEKCVVAEDYPVSCWCDEHGSDCDGCCEAVECGPRGCTLCLIGAAGIGSIGSLDHYGNLQEGYGCIETYDWPLSGWNCWCACNRYTNVYYWECI